MATPVNYAPQSVIARGMFNLDAFGVQDFKLGGTVRVSVSDSFSSSDSLSTSYSDFYGDLWTRGTGEVAWTATQLGNVQSILAIYAQYANIGFQWKGDFDAFTGGSDTTVNPEDVGRGGQSDINLSLISRTDAAFAGISGLSDDDFLGYTGGAADIFINSTAAKFGGDLSFGEGTRARQTLMHELGHSLGLSHPHTAYNATTGVATVSADFAATQKLGFSRLGIRTDHATDMNKEYFTIMSYDDQASLNPSSNVRFNAYTPMILDVIALQEAYGEGAGTHGPGNDTIQAGTVGYRTYFDKGGTDTIDLSLYSSGAYLDMGEDIAGAPHKVGVGMSLDDGLNTILYAGDPQHLRWFYGEYENVLGSASDDFIVDNALDNSISAGAGNDLIFVQGGNDVLDGGAGIDTAAYDGNRASSLITRTAAGVKVSGGVDGTDTLVDIERLDFADRKIALDLTGAAGSSARIIGAAFGPQYVSNAAFVGAGLALFDSGKTDQQVAELALGSALFQQLAGSRSNAAVVTQLYKSVVGVAPPAADLNYYAGLLEHGMSQADLLVFAANTDLNGVHINITGLAQSGIEFS